VETTGIEDGDEIEVNLETCVLANRTRGFQRSFPPFSPIMRAILSEGGLVPYMRKYGAFFVGEGRWS
jgi:3-isopropylmalate/(R)-2-methylmalate dehydratase small subunit